MKLPNELSEKLSNSTLSVESKNRNAFSFKVRENCLEDTEITILIYKVTSEHTTKELYVMCSETKKVTNNAIQS